MIDVVIAGVTLLALAFFFVWWRRPDWRAAMETPKRRILEQEQRFGDTSRSSD